MKSFNCKKMKLYVALCLLVWILYQSKKGKGSNDRFSMDDVSKVNFNINEMGYFQLQQSEKKDQKLILLYKQIEHGGYHGQQARVSERTLRNHPRRP